ncbi:DNA replication/repair protein RecF [Barrientosiimonas marina]|uniref:DNA replication and repair protein RecF n=1 Tax=Lentibacillus kimchii TaxID=1542911 RepID=A0ABW2URK0_9BACI
MHIDQLQLKNFRNIEKLSVSFDDKINIIIGENAQGKTNLMEAIYVLAFTKSHRTPREKELIRWEQEYARIEGRLTKRGQSIPLEIILSAKGKRAKLNWQEQKKLSDYIGGLNVVMFAPEHLSLVKGEPKIRRHFIDMELGQIQPAYVYHLGQYQKILRQRNHLLKQLQRRETQDTTTLHVLTDQIVQHAATLVERRFVFLDLLRQWAAPIHEGISNGSEQLTIRYAPTVDVSEWMTKAKLADIYANKFRELQAKEIERGTTLIGPHRDDVHFHVNAKNVQTYGSQGQQRTTALSVKLAEIELICHEVGEYPVLILDDVLSELDDFRQSHLLNTIRGKVQTFVSTTTIDGIDEQTLEQAQLFHVSGGTINT